MHSVSVYFDVISPYAWLGVTALPAFPADLGVRWDLRPVVYAKLLDAHGLSGPAEVAVRRRYLVHDVHRLATLRGLTYQGPPAHPFRSLEALRTICLFREAPQALDLAVGLLRACWEQGRDLTDLAVVGEVVATVGLDAGDLAARVSAPEVKRALIDSTQAALDAGVFGVPTCVWQGELFWGQDRLSHLEARLRGSLPGLPAGDAARLLARPRGADRPGRPPA